MGTWRRNFLAAMALAGVVALFAWGAVILAPGFAVAQPGSTDAAPSTITPEDVEPVDRSADERVIRVGYFAFSGYHNKAQNGSLSGYGYDFLQMIGVYLDATYEYVGYDKSYSDALDMLSAGEVDLVTSVSKTPEREEEFLFSDQPIGTNSTMFTVRAGDTRVAAGDFSTYDGMVIGMIEGNSKNEVFAAFAAENGFTYHAVYFETEEELISALQDGQVEGAVTGSLRIIDNEWIIETLSPSPFYVCTRKDDPELMAEINAAIAQLDVDEPNWRDTLNLEYYVEDQSGQVMLNVAERDYLNDLRESGEVLTVLVNPDRYPYSYFEDDEPAGIMVEVFKSIAEKLGLSYEFVRTDSQAEYYQVRSDDDIDIVIDFLDNYYTAEQEGYKITKPYLDTGFVRLTRAENEERGMGERVSTVRDAKNLISFITERYPDIQLVYYDDLEAAVDAVRDGEVDSTIIYYYTAEDIIHRDVRNELSFNMLSDARFSYAMATNVHGPTALLTALKKGIDALGSTGVSTIINAETGTEGHHINLSIGDYLYNNPLYLVVIVAGMFLLAFTGAMLVVRSRNQRRLQATVDDVSAKYEAQKEELARALSLSEQANRAKTTFLNSMSHDIRTPMNAIIGFARLAADHIDDQQKTRDYLGKIAISSEHLLSLINDVLDMSRIESGTIAIDNHREDVVTLVQAVSDIVAAEVDAKGIAFAVETDGVVHRLVECDRLHLNQVLLNLLSNAIKFTPEGGRVRFSVAEEPGRAEGRGRYVFKVSDTGIGMAEEFMETIFDPFTRERTSTVSGIQGTGLGMSITKSIVDLMGGTIEVASEVGKGTTVSVELELELIVEAGSSVTGPSLGADREAPGVAADPDEEVQAFTGRRLLLVEDNLFNRELALDLLGDAGFETEVAEDGVYAVDIIAERPPHYFDAVLMDIQMPIMDGYEATKRIRALDGERACVPIIALTADAFEEDRQRALDAGMDGHLAKPVNVDELLVLLRSTMRSCHGGGAPIE